MEAGHSMNAPERAYKRNDEVHQASSALNRMIAVTGYASEADRRRSETIGFDQHLIKPVDPEAVQQVLATLN
jgi:CheY-like chemotaxis protein